MYLHTYTIYDAHESHTYVHAFLHTADIFSTAAAASALPLAALKAGIPGFVPNQYGLAINIIITSDNPSYTLTI